MSDQPHILIAVHPNFYNKGDAAILHGLAHAFCHADPGSHPTLSLITPWHDYDRRQCSDFRLVPFFDPCDTRLMKALRRRSTQRLGPVALDLLLRRLTGNRWRGFLSADVWRAFHEADAILVGLNGTLTAAYGPSGLYYNAYWIFLARFLRIPVFVFGASTEPTANRALQRLTLHALERADLITLRERLSLDYLIDLGVTTEMVQTADLAYLVQELPLGMDLEARLEKLERENDVLVGMTVSRSAANWLFPESPDPIFAFVEHFGAFVDGIASRYNAAILFVPHSVGPSPLSDDRILARRLWDSSRAQGCMWCLEDDLSPGTLKSLIGRCDVFVGARTHSVLHALAMGVPSIVIAASHFRPRGIIGELLDDDSWVYEGAFDRRRFETLVSKLLAKRHGYFTPGFSTRLARQKERAMANAHLVLGRLR